MICQSRDKGVGAAGRLRVRGGLTLVELLVVIAIIGMLLGLLLPAVQSARESARRASCGSNMRQLGQAATAHHTAKGRFPSGSVAKELPGSPGTPWNFYRWSALAMLSPYLENKQAYRALDLSVPLYNASLVVSPENRDGAAVFVSIFLCPSDLEQRVHPDFGPTNYAACAGTGIDGGSPFDTDGIFYVNSRTTIIDLAAGTSNTALMSESVLGVGGSAHRDPQTAYRFHLLTPLTEAACEGAILWNYRDPRGFAWVNGEYRCALYNHYLSPNSPTPDCISSATGGPIETRYAAYGWRGARSWHKAGVNVVFADGSVRFINDDVEMPVWQKMATR
ncbi:MAG: DUF1559 domain-containing protein [Pirellulales bacterium]